MKSFNENGHLRLLLLLFSVFEKKVKLYGVKYGRNGIAVACSSTNSTLATVVDVMSIIVIGRHSKFEVQNEFKTVDRFFLRFSRGPRRAMHDGIVQSSIIVYVRLESSAPSCFMRRREHTYIAAHHRESPPQRSSIVCF